MSRAHEEIMISPSDDLFKIQDEIITNKMQQKESAESYSVPYSLNILIPFCEKQIKNLDSALEDALEITPIVRASVKNMADQITFFCENSEGRMICSDEVKAASDSVISVLDISSSVEELNSSVTRLTNSLLIEVNNQNERINTILEPFESEIKALEAQRDKIIEPLRQLVDKQVGTLDKYMQHIYKDLKTQTKKEEKAYDRIPVPGGMLKEKKDFVEKIARLIENIQTLLRKPSKDSTPEDYKQLKENILALSKEQENAKNVLSGQRETKGKIAAKFGYTSKGEDYAKAFSKFLAEFSKQAKIQSYLTSVSATVGAGSRQNLSDEKLEQQRENSRSFSGLEETIAKIFQQAIILYKIEDSPRLSKFSVHGGGKQKLRGVETSIYLLDKVSEKMGNIDMNVECLAVVYALLKNNDDKNLQKHILPVLELGIEGLTRKETLASLSELIKEQCDILGRSFDDYEKIIEDLSKAIKEGPKPAEYAKKIDSHLDKLIYFMNPAMKEDRETEKFRTITGS